MSSEEELYKANKPLIYKVIEDMHLHWNTQDEFQEFEDAGVDGLLNGIRSYDIDKGVKSSTYFYTCIKNEICKFLVYKNRLSNTVNLNKTSLNRVLIEEELIELIPSEVDVEEEVYRNIVKEDLLELVESLKPSEAYIIKNYYGLDHCISKTDKQLAQDMGLKQSTLAERKRKCLNKLWRKIRQSDRYDYLYKR